MKKNLLLGLSLMLLSTYSAVAQFSDYIPLVVEGARWDGYVHVEGWLYEHQEYHPYSIVIEGDTTINDTDYKKCHYLFPEINQAPNKYTTVAYLREDINQQKVYAIYEESYMSPINTMWSGDLYDYCLEHGFNEVLLYDFNNPSNPDLYPEDYFSAPSYTTSLITTDDGVTRRCHQLSDGAGSIIEGIGYADDYHNGDLLFKFPLKAACPCNTTVNFMQYYNENNDLVYRSPRDNGHKFHESITRDNVRWEYIFRDTNFMTGITTEKTFWIEMKENTKINDQYYYRCVAWSNENDSITLGYVRDDESNRQVLCRYESDINNEVVLYDYNDITNAAPLQYINTAFTNISTENFRYSYRNHDKFTVKDDNDNTLFQIIEGIGFISDGTSYSNGHLLNYPTIAQPDSRDYRIIFNRIFNPKDGSTIYEAPAGVENTTINNQNELISINNGAITTSQDALIEVLDINGRKVASTHGTTLSITSLPSGLYIIKATSYNNSTTIKIAIK